MKKTLLSLSAILLLAACTDSGSTGDYTNMQHYTIGNGPVLIEEFSDFQCPACGSISPLVKAYALQNPDKVTFEYNHFPLSQHPQAIPAAVAAECAGVQGKFWEFEALLFENQDQLGDEFYAESAKEIGLDEAAFEACLEDNAMKEKVLLQAREGRERNVNATPTLFVSTEGEEPQKVQFSDQFFAFVEQKAKTAGVSSSTPINNTEESDQ